MFVTKSNMANAVASVSKQLENVSDALAVSVDYRICNDIVLCGTLLHIVIALCSLQSGICQRGSKTWIGSWMSRRRRQSLLQMM